MRSRRPPPLASLALFGLAGLVLPRCDCDGGGEHPADARPPGPDGVIEAGFCGDGDCRLKAGENTHLCPADCGQPSGTGAVVRFFIDFPKSPEPDERVRFTTVVWNEGSEVARNVVLAVPVVLNPDTPLIGDRWWCDYPADRYHCMEDLSYVPGTMRVNRIYHPNRARNSYAFVDTIPLTDEPDDDEGYYDADQNFLFLTIPELRPRSDDPETAGYLFSYELVTDGAAAQNPCADNPLIQNWNYIFADNAEPYLNDIIGHLYCEAPRLQAELAPERTDVAPGETVSLAVTMRYDDIVPPPGQDISRFTVLRPRFYLGYPEPWVEVTGIDKPDEAEDLPPPPGAASGGGVVYWARQNDAGDTEILPGESETLTLQIRVADGLPTGLALPLSVKVRSQRTLPYQEVEASVTLTVTGGAAPTCGDGLCSSGEDAASCAADCPACAGPDEVTSFGEPPCCDGLTLVRASHPYSWAYDQCYDWEGGGVPYVQGYCTACGDGQCTGLENPCNCPADCGPHCGNWVCEAGETRSTCPEDC